jgi:DNA-binding SARP family transcriptional activator
MTGRTKLARRIAAALAATTLLLLLVLAWDLRPALPPMPQSFSEPLPGRTISGVLNIAAWAVAVLLDIVLLGKVVQFGLRSAAGGTEQRLRRAFAQRGQAQRTRSGDWRTHAAPLAPPVLRLPLRRECESKPLQTDATQHDLHESPIAVEAANSAHDERPSVLLLGPFELAGCKRKQPRRQATTELIAYLAMQRRRVNRDELLEALWPGDDPQRSAGRLYQAVSEARKLLGDAVQRDHDTYALDRERLRIDVDELDGIRLQAVEATGDAERVRLERALALFRGDPLARIDALWAESEQRRLIALRVDLLERAGRLRLESGEASGALELAEAAAALDASNERPIQLAMEAEAVLGRREAVEERYERLRGELDERFGLEPSRATKMLYRDLLSQDRASSPAEAERRPAQISQ